MIAEKVLRHKTQISKYFEHLNLRKINEHSIYNFLRSLEVIVMFKFVKEVLGIGSFSF